MASKVFALLGRVLFSDDQESDQRLMASKVFARQILLRGSEANW